MPVGSMVGTIKTFSTATSLIWVLIFLYLLFTHNLLMWVRMNSYCNGAHLDGWKKPASWNRGSSSSSCPVLFPTL